MDSISPSEIGGKNDNIFFWNKPLPSHCDHSHGKQNVLREKRWNCTHSDLWTTPDLPVRWWTSPSRPRLDRWGSSVVDRRALSPRTTIRWAGRWFFLLDPPCSDPSSYVQSSQVPSTAPRATRSYETLPKVDSNDGYSNIARYSPWRLLHQPIWQICSNWIAFPQLLRWCFFFKWNHHLVTMYWNWSGALLTWWCTTRDINSRSKVKDIALAPVVLRISKAWKNTRSR